MKNIDILSKGPTSKVPFLLSSKNPYSLTPNNNFTVSPDLKQINVRYFEEAGKCLHDKHLHFTNYDHDFPASTVIKEAFKKIRESPEEAVLRDSKIIYNSNQNFKDRLQPILELHLNKTFDSDEGMADIVEARIHSSDYDKGSFRAFMKWYSKGTVINGEAISKNLLIVVLYDPFHLVFPDDRHRTDSYNQVKGNDKALCDRYYSHIPKEYRIDFI
ncbi:hypothetical protein [uncultured Fructobacillus sp.]|uniref:hypothetical protein n=1 Tax=uncultured Fructobacillus sp. TaxID=591942 RepID=UPI0025922A50|nr:hypothetical protein [uncultured Fructobacillus sp.]